MNTARLRYTALPLFALCACGDDPQEQPPPQPVEVKFSAVVGAEPFECGRTYAGIGTSGATVTPVDLRFYVTDVSLLTAAGETHVLQLDQNPYQYQNVALIDFENGEGSCDQGDVETHTAVAGRVPAGSYTGLKFTLGIPLALNHVALDSQPSPLNKSAMYWGWTLGHLFLAATVSAEGPGGTPNDHFTHLGSTECEGDPQMGTPVTFCGKPNRREYTIDNFAMDTNSVVVDLRAIKAGVDVVGSAGCHSFDEAPCAPMFGALGIDFVTGGPKETQTAIGIK